MSLAGDLAGSGSTTAPVKNFLGGQKKSSGSGPPGAPGSGPPGGGNPGNPPGGIGPPHPPAPPPGGGGGGGGEGGGGGAAVGGGGPGNGKLGGNPPKEFDGNRALAETFINDFDLYRLTNIDADQMTNPMKRATLFLSYIKGPMVRDWVKRWIQWTIGQYTTGRPSYDEYYWTEIAGAFQNAFQDTGKRERAEQSLKNLSFDHNSVDTFLAQFESLAEEAEFGLDTNPTMSMLASKLPFGMMNHIVKIVRPHTFRGWLDAIRQYHADNTAVNNLKGNQEQKSHKKNATGITPEQWAKILGVKLPKDPNAMDTSAGRTKAYFVKKKTQGRAVETKEKFDSDTQKKEGRCFNCNQQGHMSKNCPKPKKDKGKTPIKARIAETEESSAEENAAETSEDEDEREIHALVGKAKTWKTKKKMSFIKRITDLTDESDGELDF